MGSFLRALALAAVAVALLAPGSVAATEPVPTKARAISMVKKVVRKNSRKCRLSITSVGATRLPIGWRVTVTVKIRGHRGQAAWHVRGSEPKPADPFAEKIGKGCR